MSLWLDHVERWQHCTECPLCEQRDKIVLARGVLPADVCFVGEAPGDSEDTLGLPFVGPAGHLMDQIIERSVPKDIRYCLTNLVACYPRNAKMAGTNEPEYDEIEACRERLVEFIHIAQPKLLICVGRLASDHIPPERELWEGLIYKDVVHPAAILRMPAAQKTMATQKCIVIIRNAIEDMLQSKLRTPLQTGENHASKSNQAEPYNLADSGLYDANFTGCPECGSFSPCVHIPF